MGVNIERLERLLRSSNSPHDREAKLALSRLLLDLKDRRKSGSPHSRECFTAAFRALHKIKGPIHAEIRLDCINQCIQYFYANHMGADALVAAKEFRDLSRLSRLRVWMQRAENICGIVQADLGNASDAVPHYYAAISLAKEDRNLFAEICALVNLGVALNYSGLYREAIPCFEKASRLARSNATVAYLEASAASNLAQSHLYLGEFRQGFDAIVRALKQSPEPVDSESALSRSIRECTFVQLALELGRYEEASEHAVLCQKYADRSRTSRGALLAEVTLGLCEIFCGDIDCGVQKLEAATINTEESSAMHLDTLALLVKAYEHAGRPHDALRCMRQLLHLITAAREKSVSALLSFSSHAAEEAKTHLNPNDLATLQHKEASLRASVAERQLFSAQVEMLERLAVTADLKEDQSGQHGYRVGRLSFLLAKELDWSLDECFALELAARLHDIGKIGIPDKILFTTDQLKNEQRDFMRAHTKVGAELLSKGNNAQLKMAEQVARFHHEWWNGNGYPNRVAGTRIPLHARIVALADVFDALTHGRPYAEPWGFDQALQELGARSGTQFDPQLVDRFVTLLVALRNEHTDLEAFLSEAGQNSPFAQARKNIRDMLGAKREQEREFNAQSHVAHSSVI
jgi:putative two-component system response regulator